MVLVNARTGKRIAGLAVLCGLLMVAGGMAPSAVAAAELAWSQDGPGQGAQDQQIVSDLAHVLKGKRLQGVTPQVTNGVVTLSGSVENYQDKLDAEKKAHKVPGIQSIQNQIQVGGPQVSDEQLGQKLSGKLGIDGSNPNLTQFEFFSISVQNGVVTLNGYAVLPTDKDWAMVEVATLPGVKGIVDHVQVAPLSPNDDRIRRAVSNAIYGYPMFTRYAINPEKPIRILVLNGNVTLAGVVDSNSEKEVAYVRANGVGGVFKVTNNLQVQGTNEK